MSIINDEQARSLAINPTQSFIVQAPAGSGKTELLTQRYLQLLAHAEKNPEEIIAVTFTKKAAAEMRQRIVDALSLAANHPIPNEPHKQTTWKLANDALKKDESLNWALQKNPNRLRILTIDALSTYLVKQMPLTANMGPQFEITDKPKYYYRETVETIFLSMQDNPPWTSAIQILLLHLDNRTDLLTNLLIEILQKREQWLSHIVPHQNDTTLLRKTMQAALENVAIDAIITAKQHLTNDILSELIPLADFAGHYCSTQNPEHPIAHCKAITLLEPSLELLPAWLGVSNLLLTQKGEWRKSITKREGFPAKGENKSETESLKANKSQMLALLESLSGNDALKSLLYDIMLLPPLTYNENQWEIIDALIILLPILAAQLNLVFQKNNKIDFIGLSLAALQALGDEESPTDLALHLDYQIKHLLIDEFQDTSVIQFTLIEKLIAGWQPNDGRTLFLVGDPMQSIYRFRNAEVGLFLRAQQCGINNILLKRLTLTNNFRSSETIVNWNNKNFNTIFPNQPDISLGATPYTESIATHNISGTVDWHTSINDEGINEAEQVVKQIQNITKQNPSDTIAILVRSRSHLLEIIPLLHHNNIDFQAVDLEPLLNKMEVQDAHALTRALLHRGDRIAWLSLLRAPYTGLTLTDLYQIAEAANGKSIYSALKTYHDIPTLSEEAKARLNHTVPAICHTVENLGRYPFSKLLKNLWSKLNPSQAFPKPYLKLIEKLEMQNVPLSAELINERLVDLYAEPNPNSNANLQIMTIHKAKGLEFDHVFLPGLHRKSPPDQHQILKWLERQRFNTSDLILAPIKATDQQSDPTYAYLKRIEKLKSDFEQARLFYVATTRAKKSLHFFANVDTEDDTIKNPNKGSFLDLVWHEAQTHFTTSAENTNETHTIAIEKPQLIRFARSFYGAIPPQSLDAAAYSQPINIELEDTTARHIGTLIHEALEHLAKHGNTNSSQWPLRIKQYGMPTSQHDNVLKLIQSAIEKTQNDPRGQWIISTKHQDTKTELPLTMMEDGKPKHLILDRTFIDNGVRWIIDYKTAKPDTEALATYQNQLNTYAKAYSALEPHPIKCALYFPLSSEWIEWDYKTIKENAHA